jgi:hypothetical protein
MDGAKPITGETLYIDGDHIIGTEYGDVDPQNYDAARLRGSLT